MIQIFLGEDQGSKPGVQRTLGLQPDPPSSYGTVPKARGHSMQSYSVKSLHFLGLANIRPELKGASPTSQGGRMEAQMGHDPSISHNHNLAWKKTFSTQFSLEAPLSAD